MASKEQVSKWFDEGIQENATHMIVVHDSDYKEFPVYVSPEQDVKEVEKQYSNQSMQRIVCSYKLKSNKETQINATHPINYKRLNTTKPGFPQTKYDSWIKEFNLVLWSGNQKLILTTSDEKTLLETKKFENIRLFLEGFSYYHKLTEEIKKEIFYHEGGLQHAITTKNQPFEIESKAAIKALKKLLKI